MGLAARPGRGRPGPFTPPRGGRGEVRALAWGARSRSAQVVANAVGFLLGGRQQQAADHCTAGVRLSLSRRAHLDACSCASLCAWTGRCTGIPPLNLLLDGEGGHAARRRSGCSVTLGPGDCPRRRLARPRTAGIVGQLPRVRGRTPGLPRGASARAPRAARLPCSNGSPIAGYRQHSCGNTLQGTPRGGLSSSTPNRRARLAPGTAPEDLVAPRESSKSPMSSPTTGLSTGAPRALRAAVVRRPGQGSLAGALGRAVQHVLLYGRPACPWNAASGVFPDRYGPRNPSCSVVPNCSARTCVSS